MHEWLHPKARAPSSASLGMTDYPVDRLSSTGHGFGAARSPGPPNREPKLCHTLAHENFWQLPEGGIFWEIKWDIVEFLRV